MKFWSKLKDMVDKPYYKRRKKELEEAIVKSESRIEKTTEKIQANPELYKKDLKDDIIYGAIFLGAGIATMVCSELMTETMINLYHIVKAQTPVTVEYMKATKEYVAANPGYLFPALGIGLISAAKGFVKLKDRVANSVKFNKWDINGAKKELERIPVKYRD